MTPLIEAGLKSSILMTAAAATVVLLYRGSAATRHLVWTLAIVGLLALPILPMWIPAWRIAVPMAVGTAPFIPASASDVEPAPANRIDTPSSIRLNAQTTDVVPGFSRIGRTSMTTGSTLLWLMLPAIYVLGLFTLLARVLAQRHAGRRIAREATPIVDSAWTELLHTCMARIGVDRRVTLLRSRAQLIPMTMGTIAPVVVVPADADAWDEDRRRAVLLHELAHIARHDCFTQTLCAIACAIYWVHPGVWYVARRLRIERELACDDRVLAAGARARDYAGHLLELAYSWSGRRAPALVVGMAGSRKLEGRMRAVLDPSRNRATPTRRAALVGAALFAALLLPIAALTMSEATASADVRSELMQAGATDATAADQPAESQAQTDTGGSDRDSVSGTWELRPARSSGRVSLSVRYGDSSFSTDVDASEIDDLSGQAMSRANGPVRFSIPREAGTLRIEGTMRNGAGRGTFTFVPSPAFIASFTARGFARPTAVQAFALAQAGVGVAFVDELSAQKYTRPDVSDLVRAAHHGVDIDYLREMGQTGYRLGMVDVLIRFRDHGVSPDFIRDLRTHGLTDLSPDDLVRARDHGVDAEFLAGFKDLGYSPLPFDTLIRARDHGVDPEYVGAMRQAGFRVELPDLIRARDHGVTPEYISALRASGYSSLPMDDVIRARDHGVDPQYLRDMRDVGYKLTLEQLIRARDHGVTPDYIVGIAVGGYKDLPVDSLIRLRDHGVTPEYLLELRKRGINNLSVDELIRLRDRSASSDYHLDRLIASLRNTEAGRWLEEIVREWVQ